LKSLCLMLFKCLIVCKLWTKKLKLQLDLYLQLLMIPKFVLLIVEFRKGIDTFNMLLILEVLIVF
jgi:hypothetical protein